MPDKTAITNVDGPKPAVQDDTSKAPGVDGLVSDSKTLSEDVAEWLRLKVQLIQIEVHERIRGEVNAVLSSIIVLGLLLVAFLLGMMALGHYLGSLFENSAYGFAATAAFVAIVALILGRVQPQWMGEAMYSLVPRRWFKGKKSKDENTPKS